MPSIPITDGVSVTADADLAPWSSLAQYATELPKLVAAGADLARWRVLTLADPAVRTLSTALALDRPVPLGGEAPALTLGGSAGVNFEVLTGAMFSPDVYGDNVAIAEGECALRIGLSAGPTVGVSASAGMVVMGFDASAGIAIDSYRRFPARGNAPTVLAALQQSVAELVIPFQPADVQSMPAGTVCTAAGTGSLKFSATANLLAIANPLASATLPAPLPGVSVTQGASVAVGASWEVESEYQVRVEKVDAGRARVGWYRRHGSEFSVKASAGAGISAGTTSLDLFPKIVGAISADAKADEAELARAGLSAANAGAIEDAVRRAVSRRLEVAVAAEFGSLQKDEAAFLYELELGAMDDEARGALGQALHGDLSGLAALPKGVTEVRSILTQSRARRFTFRVNLLGIFNFASVTRLALQGTVTWTPSTGELLIVDQATAARIQTTAVNFGANEQKLRQVMAESFLITAAYRGSETALAPPELKSTHSFFRLDANTSRAELARFMMALSAVKLTAPSLPEGAGGFGRTTMQLDAAYDNLASRALFVDSDGRPRSEQEYERCGRLALNLLVPADADDAFRLRPTTDDALWARMKDLGPANFGQLFPREQAPVITADYLTIAWWIDSMRETAELVAQILRPGAADSTALRRDLAKHLRDVASRSRELFGEPWGLVAMFLVSGARAIAGGSVTGPKFVFTATRSLTAGT